MGVTVDKMIYCCGNKGEFSERQLSQPSGQKEPMDRIELRSPGKFIHDNPTIEKIEDFKLKAGDFVLHKDKIFEKYEKMGDIIGEGTYGRIIKVKNKSNGEFRAVKVISKKIVKNGVTYEDVINEIDILRSLDHPNIIKIFEFFTDEDNFYLVTEYCEEGDLFDHIHELDLDENVVCQIIFQILTAVNYLNQRNIFHGDLKLENILIDRKTIINKHSHQYKVIEIKLIDFGCSKIFQKNEKYNDIIGTLHYCSPEVLKMDYNYKCDCWSTGVIMYLLITGKYPIDASKFDLIEKIEDPNFEIDYSLKEFKDISEEGIQFLKSLLTYDHRKRPSASEALKFIWIFKAKIEQKKFVEKQFTKDVLQNLLIYKHEKTFKNAVLTYLTHNLGKNEETLKLREVFRGIDEDNDGIISKEDMRKALSKNLGYISAKEADNIIEEIDMGLNGGIEYEEFLRATMSKSMLLTEENLKEAFDLFDTNKEGYLTVDGLKRLLSNGRDVKDEVMKEIFEEIHKNSDEKIHFKDFTKIMLRKGSLSGHFVRNGNRAFTQIPNFGVAIKPSNQSALDNIDSLSSQRVNTENM